MQNLCTYSLVQHLTTWHDTLSDEPPDECETDSSVSDCSNSSDSDSSWRSMSPISSDEEYLSDKSDEDGDITGHDIVTEVDAYTDPTSSSQLESHIDKTVRQQYMRSDSHGTRSLHYFHSYAIADRIKFSNLSQETQPSRSLNSHTQALLLLGGWRCFEEEFQNPDFKNSLWQHSLLQNEL